MGKRKYTTELKLKIVEEYLNGYLGIKTLAEKYHVGYGNVQKWIDAYREHGLDGLCKKLGSMSIVVVKSVEWRNHSYMNVYQRPCFARSFL